MNAIRITIDERAIGAAGQQATARRVVRVGDAEQLVVQRGSWKPTTPARDDRIEATLAMSIDGKRQPACEVDAGTWQAIRRSGLDRFLMSAVAERGFVPLLRRVAGGAAGSPRG